MENLKIFLKNKFPILLKLKYLIRGFFLSNNLDYLEFHLTNHCNLKCNACTHFSNISTEYFLDGRVLETQLHRLNTIFGKIKRVRILGGEPLLHPDIINILKIVRHAFPISYLEVYTNGLLLNKMPQEFFKICKEKNIHIYISLYQKDKKIKDEFEKILSSYKIKYTISPTIYTFEANLNPKGTSNQEETFQHCKQKACTILKEGYIYICPITAYIDTYNKYFNKNIPQGKGINIFTSTSQQILQYLKNSEQTCKYCTNNTKYNNWKCSLEPKETDWNGKID